MALQPCLTASSCFVADRALLRPASLPCPDSPSRPYDRGAVRLNVPTVASLRRQSMISSSTKATWETSMPLTESASLLASSPTHMQVFGDGPCARDASIKVHGSLSSRPLPSRAQSALSRTSSYQTALTSASRRGSGTTLKSDSTESSPTTTISTVDSNLTEPSPSSSPESPTSSLLNTYGSSKGGALDSAQSMEEPFASDSLPQPGFESPETKSKRPRNLRNLSINTRGISTRPATTAGLVNASANQSSAGTDSAASAGPPLPFGGGGIGKKLPRSVAHKHSISEPASPSFILPSILPPRKGRLGLTISTSESNGASHNGVPSTPAFAPPTMSLRRQATEPQTPGFGFRFATLREVEEPLFSPSDAPAGGMQLPPMNGLAQNSLPTPSFGPEGGMSLPSSNSQPEITHSRRSSRPALSLRRDSQDDNSESAVVHQTVEHTSQIPLHDLPLSQEVKSPSYPEGPICIYPPSVYLYHQPTCEEARNFDVIINVAKEVVNPFTEEGQKDAWDAKEEPKYKDAGTQCTLLPAPPLVGGLASPFASTESQIEEGPETPKATVTPMSSKEDPEYIHLPWEHNSHVFDSLLEICELIDSRVKDGKRVLIHCQLGVSRSASLIVAYGLYKNPSLRPDEAREQAKKQSRWIDLNMHFMYELGDFKKILSKQFPDAHPGRRPSGLAPLARTKTEGYLGHESRSRPQVSPSKDDQEARRSSSIEPSTQYASATGEEERGPSSAPVGMQWSPTAVPTEFNHEVEKPVPSITLPPTFHESPAIASETDVDTSDVPTPVRANSAEPNAINGTERPSDADQRPRATLPPNTEISFLQDFKPFIPASDSDVLDPSAAGLSSPRNSTFGALGPVPNKIRPMPSMPSLPTGLSSARRVPPGLSVKTNGTNVPTAIEPPTDPSAPSLPPLDFGGSLLMSPRAVEFIRNPWQRNSLAGDLAGAETSLMSPAAEKFEVDPRSPAAKGEYPITRSIDEVL